MAEEKPTRDIRDRRGISEPATVSMGSVPLSATREGSHPVLIVLTGNQMTSATLQDGDRLQLGPSMLLEFAFQDDLRKELQEQLHASAIKDALTGIFQKRYLVDRLEREIAYCRRHGRQFSLLLFDLDHFKAVNDRLGHLAGDRVLEAVARRVAISVRAEDVFARYGGEEFGILLVGCDAENALKFAERVRKAVEAEPIVVDGMGVPVTMSAGLATYHKANFETAEAMVAEADAHLYRAKDLGRNRVESGAA